MKTPSFNSVVAGMVVLAGGAMAQLATITLPYVDGDTLVVSTGTNALGAPITQTIRTVTGTALTTPLVSSSSSAARVPGQPIVTSASSSSSSSARLVTSTSSRTTRTTAPLGAVPTTDQGMRVGQDTALPPPMRTTTYYYDTGNGYWTVATWTASVTGAPAVATVIPAAGTMQDYQQYQTSVNKNVLASAQASVSKAAGEARAVVPAYNPNANGGWVGWGIMGVGAIVGAAVAL